MKAHDKKVMDEINITPLTDIFLVLLIIMMVIAPMLDYRALQVRYASADAAETETKESKVMSLFITEVGEVQVEGTPVGRGELVQRISEGKAEFPDGIEVTVAPEASLDAMAFALNAVEMAGVQKVSVALQEDEPAPEEKESKPPAKPAKKGK